MEPSTNRLEVVEGSNFTILCNVTVPGISVILALPPHGEDEVNVPFTRVNASTAHSGVYTCLVSSQGYPSTLPRTLDVTVLVFPGK